jgi:hypothetical protein
MPISQINTNSIANGAVIQADLGTGVAGTGPAFSAYPSNNSTVPALNTFTKMVCGSELFDTANAFDSVTNSRFQPLVAGYYQINGSVQMNGAVSRMIVSIFKNGSEFLRGFDVIGNCGTATASAVLYLNGTTDYVELYTYNGSGGVAIYGAGSQFSGALVRAA